MQKKRIERSNIIERRVSRISWEWMGKYIGLLCIILLGIFPGMSSAASTNIVINPGFELGIAPWVFYTNGAGNFLNDASVGHITISQTGTNVQLYQPGLVFESNVQYKLSFRAYSNTGHDLSVSLLKHGSPYTNYGLSNYEVNLGTAWNDYSIQFTTSGFSGTVNDARLMFWIASYTSAQDQYFIDDVILAKVSAGAPVPPPTTPPTITTQPLSQTISVGQTATFTVAATGTAPLSYQWRKNSANIAGAISSSYTTPGSILSDNGAKFSVIVSNSAGSVTSNAATLSVLNSNNIIKNPGFGPDTAPWVFYTNGAGNFINDASVGYITISQPGTNVQLYQADIALEPGTVYKLNFKAYSNTGHDLSVSLQKHSSPYTNYGLSNYVVNLGTAWNDYSVQFTTSGFSGTVNDARLMFWIAPYTSAADQYFIDDVILTKISAGTPVPTPTPTSPPTITTQPSSQTVSVAQTATFSVTATGTAPLSYQWQKNAVSIPGAKGATYTTPGPTLSDSGSNFRVIVSNAFGSITSNNALLTVTSAPSSNKQLILLDTTYTHSTALNNDPWYGSGKAFSFFNLPSWIPTNLVEPTNYAQGTLYQRIQVLTKPSSKSVQYQICLFQDSVIPENHACSGGPTFTGVGTYYHDEPMSSLYQFDNLDWTKSLLVEMLVIKDKNGIPVDDRYGWDGQWDGSPDLGLYYPMQARYTAIIVPSGGGTPVWP